jgi:hypothetical protein
MGELRVKPLPIALARLHLPYRHWWLHQPHDKPEKRRRREEKEGEGRNEGVQATGAEDAALIGYTDAMVLPALPRLTTASTRHCTAILSAPPPW